MADDILPKAPDSEDIREDDFEYNVQLEPKSAKAWINLLNESETAFESWNNHCDKIDKRYANLERLGQMFRNKEFQMFWANMEVIKPAIYAKPPKPVVTPKFMDRRPVYQEASEIMERCCVVAFDLAEIDELMKLLRDDLAINDRGVAWCRYESGKKGGYYGKGERVCVDFKNRRDFLHSLSRNWREVTWVAAASYLTRSEARDRFKQYSGDEYQDAEYKVDHEAKDVGGTDARERAKFWEVWDKINRRVVWVAEGCEQILDEDDPHLDLRGYFPCPKPAFGTVQRGSLVPVPDVMQYEDQLDEINLLTARIHALSDALEVKGFYPAGGSEIAEAVQAAVAHNTPGRVLVPIANWAAFGGSSDVIIWLPIDQVATTITQVVMLRKQIIDDIYQLIGLSDIMRGTTDPQETLGAQQLKTEYGSIRIRDKQQELVRIARDIVEIVSEIITEKFDEPTIIEMSQCQLPTSAMQRKQVDQIKSDLSKQMQAAQKLMQMPQVSQAAQQQPQKMQQVQQQLQQLQQAAQQSMQQILAQPTLDQVMHLFRDQRAKSFILDIETDSTINADENAEKQSRTEFVQVLGNLLPQLGQMVMGDPKSTDFAGEILKFATAPFRAGRSLEGAIDDYVEQKKQDGGGQQQQQPNPAQIQLQIEQMKINYAQQKDTADRQVKVMEIQSKGQAAQTDTATEAQAQQMEVQGRQQEQAARVQQINMEAQNQQREHEMQMQVAAMKAQAELQKHQMSMQANQAAAQQKSQHADQAAQAAREQQQFRMSQPRPGGQP